MKTSIKNNGRWYLVLLFLTILFVPNKSLAQADTITIVEETHGLSEPYYQHKYQYLDLLLGDNTSALKIAIQPFKPERYINFGVLLLQFAFEKKINSSFSLLNEINTTTFWGQDEKVNELGYALGIRWYPAKKAEMRKGLSGNTTNGPYLGLKADNIFNVLTYRNNQKAYKLDRYLQLNPTPEFSLGYQHKVSKLLYFDGNLFLNYSIQNQNFGYGITLLIGTSFNINQ